MSDSLSDRSAVGANGSGKSNFFSGEPCIGSVQLTAIPKAGSAGMRLLQDSVLTSLMNDAAIRFVISDMSAPGPEERQKLLHVCTDFPAVLVKHKLLHALATL